MPTATPAKIAVLASADPEPAPTAPPAVRTDADAVLARARELIAARSPEIVCPILDGALAAGTITNAERAALLREVVGVTDPPPGQLSLAAQRLRAHVRAAIARAAPALAKPLLDEAVAAHRLTPSQRMLIAHHLRDGARRPVSSPA